MSIKSLKNYMLSNNFLYIVTGVYMMTLLLNSVVYYFTIPAFEIIIKIFRIACYLIFMLSILKNWKNGDNITIGMIVFAVLSCVIAIFSKNKDILFLFIFCFAVKNLSIKKIITHTLILYIVTFLIIVSLSLLKIIPDWIFYRGTTQRHSLGFYYSTIAIGIYLSCMLMYFYVRKSKATVMELLLFEGINVFLYKYTDGRLSFILISIILFMMLILKIPKLRQLFKLPHMQVVLKYIGYILPISLFTMVILATYLYTKGNPIGFSINKILSGRLLYTKNAFQQYGITLFGQPIDWKGWGGFGYVDTENMVGFIYNYVDISYARIIFDYGIIPTIIILLVYTVALVKSVKEKNYWLFTVLVFVCIWSSIEPYLFNIGKNIFILSFVPIFNFGKIKQLDYNSIKSKFKKES